ncbi:MAG: lipoyl synthase [Vampirovibrionales bacterium]|nr:lipoyl synthase [Vampirovibrionales bacterium]
MIAETPTKPGPEKPPDKQNPERRKPDWLKVKIPSGENYARLKALSKTLKLATVCEEARCPNIGECWAGGTATFMLMGEVCTRGCRFCAVKTGNPNGWLDLQEPEKLAATVRDSAWEYVVLTSVDRDDLPDGGATHFARCVEAIRSENPNIIVEVLIPDFQGNADHLQTLLASRPDVVAQNIETVERLTHPVRDRRAGYQQTLTLLSRVKTSNPSFFTKSSIMLGLGETADEVYQCMQDLRAHGVDILTLGQYLQPTPKHLAVEDYITPAQFDAWKKIAEDELGFAYCASGPLVRSSYRAGEFFIKGIIEKNRTENSNISF